MERIELEDNTRSVDKAKEFGREEVADLFPIAGKTLSDLCCENENLLLFPDCLNSAKDKIGDEKICELQNTTCPDKVRIVTGNIMGFVGTGGLQVKIRSRFDTGRKDFLLHYMLQKVLSFNIFDLNHTHEDEDVFDFLMLLFPQFLSSALRQGVYREYKSYRHNDANVRGPIDITRHIARNMPFAGNVAYTTRSFSYDNDMTQLVRHTIELMQTKRLGRAVLSANKETMDNVSTIIGHTVSYNRQRRSSIISKNLRAKVHPFYTAYRPLQALCLQILRREEAKYGNSEHEISGILFDGAWLWEEYVNTLLAPKGFHHTENKLRKGHISLFADGTGWFYPDFYKPGVAPDKSDFVLDAKYKRLGSYEKVADVGREDLFQLITYIKRLSAPKGGFIAPLTEKIGPLTEKKITVPTSKLAGDNSETLSIFGIEISKEQGDYRKFCDEMAETERDFIGSIQRMG